MELPDEFRRPIEMYIKDIEKEDWETFYSHFKNDNPLFVRTLSNILTIAGIKPKLRTVPLF